MKARMTTQDRPVRITVRLPEGLVQELEKFAHDADRTMNYEIKLRLQTSLSFDSILKAPSDAETLNGVNKLRRRLIGLRLPSGSDE